jgi:hypothetical protein
MSGFGPTLSQAHQAFVLRPSRVPENVGGNKNVTNNGAGMSQCNTAVTQRALNLRKDGMN